MGLHCLPMSQKIIPVMYRLKKAGFKAGEFGDMAPFSTCIQSFSGFMIFASLVSNFRHVISNCSEGLFCLFDLILYVPVNNFSVMSGRVFLS